MEVPNVEPTLPGFKQGDDEGPGHRYRCAGKEVICCGAHYADAISADAAEHIATAMNAADLQQDWARLISQIR